MHSRSYHQDISAPGSLGVSSVVESLRLEYGPPRINMGEARDVERGHSMPAEARPLWEQDSWSGRSCFLTRSKKVSGRHPWWRPARLLAL
jgi:hypothetical protein